VAELVRQSHDLTVGTPLAGGQEVVCHNDLSPKNTVYQDLGDGLRPVAFLDWDLAAPGRRVHDVAHLCWQFLGLGPSVVDPVVAVRRLRLVCEAYGLAERDGGVAPICWTHERLRAASPRRSSRATHQTALPSSVPRRGDRVGPHQRQDHP
jgi:aminoglycoside phosphotransferase (APT) family kinase protein